MSAVLVDTDVVGLLFANDPECEPYAAEIAGKVALVSFQTVAEVECWTVERAWTPERCAWMHLYLERYTAVPSSPDLCRRWAEVLAAGEERGQPVTYGNAWIAATALLYRVPLLTHNLERYRGIPAVEAVSYRGAGVE
jgi:predicted nucleic acid-binding protein